MILHVWVDSVVVVANCACPSAVRISRRKRQVSDDRGLNVNKEACIISWDGLAEHFTRRFHLLVL